MSADAPLKSANGRSFAGRRRVRTTKPFVRVADMAAQFIITLGGLGTIAAVGLVCVFLVGVVIPLFVPESASFVRRTPLDIHDRRAPPSEALSPAAPRLRTAYFTVDEYATMGWSYFGDGVIRGYRLDNGQLLSSQSPFAEKPPTAAAFSLREGHAAFAFDDSTVRLGHIDFTTTFVPPEEIPESLKDIPAGQSESFRDGLLERTVEGQYRLQMLHVKLEAPTAVEAGKAIVLIDQSVSTNGVAFAALTQDGELYVARVTRKENVLTGQVTTKLRKGHVSVELPHGQLPQRILLAGLGDSVYLAWEDGLLLRFDTREITEPILAERVDLLPDPQAKLTSLVFLLGKTSLAVGDSLGNINVWFRIKPADATTPDGGVLVKAHTFASAGSPVTSLVSSSRSRLLAAGFADGRLRVLNVTSEQPLVEVRLPDEIRDRKVRAVTITPKEDAVLAVTSDSLSKWSLDAPHAEITWSSIFRPVWYEGYEGPDTVWQSSSGTDDFEPKYGLFPLVFGTLKATFYSMLFGAPLALLAAIYTSQFLHPSTKARVKPTIEIMASLPSVVLGFLAAQLFAPLVEEIVPHILTAFVTIPFTLLMGAYLWQLLPTTVAVKSRKFRLLGMTLALPAGLLLAALLGRPVERWLFAGNIMSWLDGQRGTGTGAWLMFLLPISGLSVAFASGACATPWLRRVASGWSRTQFASLDLLKFLVACSLTLLLAYVVALLLSGLGLDPRGSFLGTYIQRNALVVGFIMGFAIIPIIFTIADDALSAVPEALRAGSLGAGATEWQTATWVVIPTALSGLFSAVMIGLGRAVGETMIVLMAAGNTPVKEWNMFNGFRTLSANIAVELPEAVKDSTHFRMLYLAALLLFVMTFIVNTVAEIVRHRVRRKAFQL